MNETEEAAEKVLQYIRETSLYQSDTKALSYLAAIRDKVREEMGDIGWLARMQPREESE